MKKLFKRALSLAVVLVMLLGMIPMSPITASAVGASAPTTRSTRIYANGTHIYIVAGTSSGTAVYYMNGSNKVYVNPNGAAGDDLSQHIIFGGCIDDNLDADVNITMTGGRVYKINGGGFNDDYADSGYVNNVNITMTGGTVSDGIRAGWMNAVKGDVNITVTGGSVGIIDGACNLSQISAGTGFVRVHGNATITVTGGSVGKVSAGDGSHPISGTVTGLFLVPVTITHGDAQIADKTHYFDNLLYFDGSNWRQRGNVTIPGGATLTVDQGKTLNLNGSLTNNGTIINNGTVNVSAVMQNNGPLVNNGTLNLFKPVVGTGITGSGTLNVHAAYIDGVTSVNSMSTKMNGSAHTIAPGYRMLHDGKLYIFLPSGNAEVTLNGSKYYGVITEGQRMQLKGYAGVSDITGIPTQIPANRDITLSAELKPESGIMFPQTVTYELVSAPEGTTLKNGVLRASDGGTVCVRVVAKDDYNTYSEEFNIQSVFTPVTGLSEAVRSEYYQHLEYDLSKYTASPADASYSEVKWSVVGGNNANAYIYENTLTGYNTGTTTIRATVKNGLGYGKDYTQDFTIQIRSVRAVAEQGEIYYQITNPEELLWFADYVSKYSPDSCARLLNDIDMTGYQLSPICETDLYYNGYGEDLGFTGIFDGKHHVIRNLTVQSSTTKDASAGLFGTVSGTVKDLGIENFTFVDGGYDLRAGAIAGQLITADGLIENCYVVNATINPGAHVTGGIAGCVYEGTIQNCHVFGSNITGTSGRYGHIVGDSRGDLSATDRPGTVRNCYTNGGTAYSSRTGNIENCQTKSKDAFASGEVGYYLNGQQETGVWKQNVGTDAYPSFIGQTIYASNKGYGNVVTVIFSGPTVTDTAYTGQPYAGLGGTELTNDENYTGTVEVLYTGVNGTEYSSQTPPTNAGQYVLTYSIPEDDEKYEGKLELHFTIGKISLDNLVLGELKEWYDYLGHSYVKPDLGTVTCEGLTLTEGVDYVRTFENNLYVGTATMTITGIGSFTGTKAYTFDIVDHEHNWVYTWEDLTLTQVCTEPLGTCTGTEMTYKLRMLDSLEYSASVKKFDESGWLNENVWPKLTYCCPEGCINAGEHTAILTANDFTVQVPFTIEPKELILTVKGGYKEYDGTPDVEILDVWLEGLICLDPGDPYDSYDDVYEDVTLDWSNAVVVLPDVAPGTYATAIVTGVEIGGSALGNYNLQADMNAASIVGEYSFTFTVDTATLQITPMDQYIAVGAPLDQTAYEMSELPEGHTVTGIVLEEDEYGDIVVNTDNLVVTFNGKDVTAYFDVTCYYAKIQRVCDTHDTSNNGFCDTCDVYEPAVKKTELNEWGDEIETYEIWNAGQLYWFAQQVNEYGMNSATAKVMADITVNTVLNDTARPWTPIGGGWTPYAGDFDGNGYTISGLYFKDPEGSNVGLFGYTDYNFTIKNIHISNSYFEAGNNVGALIGSAGTVVEGCTVDSTVTVISEGFVGGLVGYSAYGELKNSWSAANVSEDIGLVGNNSMAISNCYTTCSELVGYNSQSASMINCYYLSGTDDGNGGKTAAQFASGEVAYLLQSGVEPDGYWDENDQWVETGAPHVWGQEIGKDAYPVLGGMKVYKIADAYSNTLDNAAAQVGERYFTTVQEAVNNAGDDYVKLLADSDETVTADGDLYLDLNGCDLAGLTISGTLYGMDSTTDDYDCSDGYGTIAVFEGQYEAQHKTDITGAIRRYVAIEEDGILSFHRIYSAVTHMTLRSANAGFGYKAAFYGDEMIKKYLTSYGFNVWVTEDNKLCASETEFTAGASGNLKSLRIENVLSGAAADATAAQTPVYADAYATLTVNGEVIRIETGPVSGTLKDLINAVNANTEGYTAQQLAALKTLVEAYETALEEAGCEIDNLLN